MLEKLNHLIDLTKTGENTYLHNKLIEIKKHHLLIERRVNDLLIKLKKIENLSLKKNL